MRSIIMKTFLIPEKYTYQNEDKNKTSNGAALKMAVMTIYRTYK